jgi:hypothetical protein
MFSHIQHEVAQVTRKSNSSELLAFEWCSRKNFIPYTSLDKWYYTIKEISGEGENSRPSKLLRIIITTQLTQWFPTCGACPLRGAQEVRNYFIH